jgi:hypothetical protein
VSIERSEIDMQNAVAMRQEPTPERFTKFERAVLSEIAAHDIGCPITLLELRSHLVPLRIFTDRELKAMVATLRDAGEPIGAHRGKLHGYYWADTPEGLETAARPMLNQAFAMLRTARKLLGRKRLKELAGQATIDEMFGAAE